MALVVLTSNENVTYVSSPRFEKVFYRGNIDDDGVLSIEDPTIEEDSYSENIEFTLSGDDGDLFSIARAPPRSVKVSLRAPLTEENLISKTFLITTLTASHSEASNSSTVLLIDLPEKTCGKNIRN